MVVATQCECGADLWHGGRAPKPEHEERRRASTAALRTSPRLTQATASARSRARDAVFTMVLGAAVGLALHQTWIILAILLAAVTNVGNIVYSHPWVVLAPPAVLLCICQAIWLKACFAWWRARHRDAEIMEWPVSVSSTTGYVVGVVVNWVAFGIDNPVFMWDEPRSLVVAVLATAAGSAVGLAYSWSFWSKA